MFDLSMCEHVTSCLDIASPSSYRPSASRSVSSRTRKPCRTKRLPVKFQKHFRTMPRKTLGPPEIPKTLNGYCNGKNVGNSENSIYKCSLLFLAGNSYATQGRFALLLGGFA
eukprot:1962808-Amphidinium_carterae.1